MTPAKKVKAKARVQPVDLARFEASDVLKALAVREERPSRVPDPVAAALRKGDAQLRKGSKVSAFLPMVKVLDNQEGNLFGDLSAEVYIVSLAFDMTGKGATKEQSKEIFRNVSRTASRPLIVSSTPLFGNIRDGDSLPLLGDGVALYGPKDPQGLLDIHVVIMENDGGYRELGAVIEATCEQLDIAGKLKELATLGALSGPQVWAARTAFDLLFHTVVAGLKNNHDDVIQDFHFSALAHQDYRAGKHPFEYRGARGVFEVIVK